MKGLQKEKSSIFLFKYIEYDSYDANQTVCISRRWLDAKNNEDKQKTIESEKKNIISLIISEE